MIASFFAITGHLITVTLENQRIMTTEWYTTQCLPKIISTWQLQHPKSKKFLHNGNASLPTTFQTVDFLTDEVNRVLLHPPYISYLTRHRSGKMHFLRGF